MKRSKDMYNKAEQFAQDVDKLLTGQPVAENASDADRADLALVDLLGRAHFVPDPRFESQLRGNLLRQLYEKEAKTVSPIKVFRSLARSALVAGLSAVLVLGVVFAVSPDVRAAAQGWLARFVEVDSPEELLPATAELPALPAATLPDAGAGDNASAGKISEPAGDLPVPDDLEAVAESVESPPELNIEPNRELLSLEEAQANLDFKIRVPAALPAGYSFLGVMPLPEPPAEIPGVKPRDDLPKVKPPQMAVLIFGNADDAMLTLSEMSMNTPAPAEVPLPAGSGGVQEVKVNGQPAQYIEGRWTPDGWVSDGQHRLHWQDAEGIMLDLTSDVLGLEELLTVAESIE